MSHNYEKELELLVLETLLPAYITLQQSKGVQNPLKEINPELLAQIKAKKRLPALLRAY